MYVRCVGWVRNCLFNKMPKTVSVIVVLFCKKLLANLTNLNIIISMNQIREICYVKNCASITKIR